MPTRRTTEKDVRKFIDYFEQQVRLVDSLRGESAIVVGSSDPRTRLAIHKKILYSALFDSLAGIRYQAEVRRNKARILRLLREHGGWPEGNLVSFPVLAERLPDPDTELAKEVVKRLSRYSTDRGNSLPLDAFDRPLADVIHLASKEERPIVDAVTHYELFYKYRTFVVHEFREPGYAMEVFADEDGEPCYHSYLSRNAKWRLLYPEAFFRQRVECALTSLCSDFISSSFTPYDHLKDSSDWLSF